MRKTNLLVLIFLTFLFLLTSCGEKTKKDLIGKWKGTRGEVWTFTENTVIWENSYRTLKYRYKIVNSSADPMWVDFNNQQGIIRFVNDNILQIDTGYDLDKYGRPLYFIPHYSDGSIRIKTLYRIKQK